MPEGPTPSDAVPRWWQRLLRARGGDTRFLIGVTFLLTFVWIRVTTAYLEPAPSVGSPGFVQIGGRTVFFGYHPHHIAWGILWLAIAGWITIHYHRVWLTRAASVMYGLGLGLIVDEASLVVRGINPGNDLLEVVILVVMIGALVMSTVYAPSFWKSIQGSVARFLIRMRDPFARRREKDGAAERETSEAKAPDNKSGGA
ncbi:MAG: hypothetical protein HYT80_05975 [Euryarchaeota archaeon]|nr:hypothetical protein [Euryarchaeota archaeon]